MIVAFKTLTAPKIKLAFSRWQADNPNPSTELITHNAYQLLVAVVLSAQATDKGVNRATAPLFAKIYTPQDMQALGEDALRHAIASIGLYRAKAKNVMALSQELLDRHGGEVPKSLDDFLALSGVGLKTAMVMMNALYGAPMVAVDTHVFRLSRRLGLSSEPTPEKMAAHLVRRIPPQFLTHAHHWLILHGRHVCKARAPQCTLCRINDVCPRND